MAAEIDLRLEQRRQYTIRCNTQILSAAQLLQRGVCFAVLQVRFAERQARFGEIWILLQCILELDDR